MVALTRREFLTTTAASAAAMALSRLGFAAPSEPANGRPNIVFIMADDLGYGDLRCYGSKTIRTPNIDRLASDGVRLTGFYSASPLCTPSRVALLTGRHPLRVGLDRVIGPRDTGIGLPASEITVAELLREAGYATACIGKWHLGHEPRFLPTRRGFDLFYGIPYSNDMTPCVLMKGEATVEDPADQATLTQRYTHEAVNFIRSNAGRPFFLYLAHTFPHVPLAASAGFRGKSRAGLYGDTVEEIDWSTGEILKELVRLGLKKQTLVVFTSDNGPWLVKGKDAGTTGGLKGGKATAFEGGVRVPCIASWPGKIRPGGKTDDPAVLTDWFTTVLEIAGAKPPADRVIDSQDIRGPLYGTGRRAHAPLVFSMNGKIQAIRSGPWKLKVPYEGGAAWMGKDGQAPHGLLLFNLAHDPGERKNVASANPAVVAQLQEQLDAFQAGLHAQ